MIPCDGTVERGEGMVNQASITGESLPVEKKEGSGVFAGTILSEGELDDTSIEISDKSSGGRKPKIYNLDMILSVGYRVNSKRGIAFRRWANKIL